MKENKRVDWIDSVRGCLIILIVIGHVIGGAESSGFIQGSFWALLRRVIYMFHVPAFFVLSGFLWKSHNCDLSFGRSLKVFVVNKFNRLMVPYIFWGGVSVIIYCLLIEHSFSAIGIKMLCLLHGGGLNSVFRANGVLWFLPVMFSVIVIYEVVDTLVDWGKRWWAHLVFAMVGLYAHRFCVYRFGIDIFPFGFALALRYLSYMVLGRFAMRLIAGWKIEISGLAGLVMSAVVFVILTFFEKETCASLVGDWMSWVIMIVVGAVMSLSFMMVSRMFDCRILRLIGQHTLGIMLMHKFVVVALETNSMKPFMTWNLFNGIIGVFVVSVSATTIALIASICICKWCPILLGVSTDSNR